MRCRRCAHLPGWSGRDVEDRLRGVEAPGANGVVQAPAVHVLREHEREAGDAAHVVARDHVRVEAEVDPGLGLAHEGLGAAGHATLLVDLDPQGNATTGSGVNKSACEKTVYGVLLGEYSMAGARVACEGGYDVIVLDIAGAPRVKAQK